MWGMPEEARFCSQFGTATKILDSTLNDNQAFGGNGNSGSGPVVLVGSALGGAINSSFGGGTVGANTLTLSNGTMSSNIAIGGENNTGTASVAALVGAGVGAGVTNYLGGSASISDSGFDFNHAQGGTANTASGAGADFANLGAGAAVFNYLGNYNSSGYGKLSSAPSPSTTVPFS